MSNEVIIDGCNVAECGFYNDDIKSRSYPEFDCYIERSGGEYDYSCARCCDRPNCQYKQLQRAKSENEKLKSRNKLYKKIIKENIEKANNNFMVLTACIQGNLSIDDVKEYAKLSAKNDELKEEVADLEDLAECKEKRIRELSSDINVKIGQITAMEMFNKQANEYNLKYKQALKEIEEIAYTTDFDIVDIQEIVDEVLK